MPFVGRVTVSLRRSTIEISTAGGSGIERRILTTGVAPVKPFFGGLPALTSLSISQ
jgi:hypothetical protein